ncbi:MAG TPA: helix-turn-helix domain-containing protein [Acidimicrobiales bacterium]|nr:helix-turn-helix domain-containing protein [Acidimicrobiales bacterium]
MDDEVQREARALGDPTRHRLFRYILTAPDAVGVADLTDHVQLNHNAVRQHLAVLKEAKLVVEDVEVRRRPGRPRLLYRLHPEAAGRWGTPGPYAWLARLLSDAVRNKVDPRQIGRQDGRRRAEELVGSGDRLDLMEEEMTRRGFRPTRTQRARQVHFVFQRCPFEDVAHADPDTVCQLHLGQAEGLAEGLGGFTVERLEAKDARRAGCRLVLRMDSDDEASDRRQVG